MQIPDSVKVGVMKLKGKDYLPVAFRLVWFRNAHPGGRIESDFLQIDIEGGFAVCRASVYDADGNLLATGTKQESRKDFPDFLEKCETGAIGRALGIAGYGTQFMADELDERDRLADAPVQRTRAAEPDKKEDVQRLAQAVRTLIVEQGLAKADDHAEQNKVVKMMLKERPVNAQTLQDLIVKLTKEGK